MILFTGILRVWPQTFSTRIYALLDRVVINTLSLFGHPLHTLTTDIWKVDVNPNAFAVVWYFNVPCYEGKVNSRYLEVVGTIFYKFKVPEVQINLHFG